MNEIDNGSEAEGAEVATMTVGERLREAREAAKMSLDEVATATRIPTRHLASLEESDFSKLPAPTYSIGFAKNYATAVGLDRNEIGDQLRGELGSTRPVAQIEAFEPADPSRAMPRWLILAALAALVAVVLGFTWLKSRELDAPDEVVAAENMAAPITEAPQPSPQPAVATGPVVLTATDKVWIEVKEKAGAILFQGEMAPGQKFEVPANAVAPLLTVGRPEALNITVGTSSVPQVGPPGKAVSKISLLAADLTRAPASPPPAVQAGPATTTAATPTQGDAPVQSQPAAQ